MAKSRSIKALVFLLVLLVLLFSSVNSRPERPDPNLQGRHSPEHIVHVAAVTSRTLMDDNGFVPPHAGWKTKVQTVGIEDYDPIDPVPSSKTTVKHGPIQHSAPLIPKLPKPLPPNYPPSP